MFVNIMKNKIAGLLVRIAVSAFCLYNGVSCVVTLYKAGSQPYLLSGTARFDFLGYYMMAAMHGVICIVLAVLLILLVRRKRRSEAKES